MLAGRGLRPDVLAYAVMANHFHLVVTTHPERSATWSARDVAERWAIVFPAGTTRARPCPLIRMRSGAVPATSRSPEQRLVVHEGDEGAHRANLEDVRRDGCGTQVIVATRLRSRPLACGPMKPRALNILCLILLIGLAIWSLVLWQDGKLDLAIYAAVWAMLAPMLVRSLLTV